MGEEQGGHWEGTKEDFGLVAGFPDDQSIAISVKDALAWDERFRSARIEVRVKRAVVTLKGLVDSAEQREQAGALADGLPSVAGVENRLRVRKQRSRGSTR